MGLPEPEYLQASATSFLIDGQELYEASLLLLCELKLNEGEGYYSAGEYVTDVYIEVQCRRTIYEIINNQEHSSTVAIKRALNAALPSGYVCNSLIARVVFADFNSDWRTKLLEVVEGKVALNQCVPIENKPTYTWENLRFRSPCEIKIAEALDKSGVLFLPNCMARLGSIENRRNKEADFLVCTNGRWGILEIDGETYHPSAAKDHERDRLFRTYGIRVIERYTARSCLDNPKGVVEQFLTILKINA